MWIIVAGMAKINDMQSFKFFTNYLCYPLHSLPQYKVANKL